MKHRCREEITADMLRVLKDHGAFIPLRSLVVLARLDSSQYMEDKYVELLKVNGLMEVEPKKPFRVSITRKGIMFLMVWAEIEYLLEK